MCQHDCWCHPNLRNLGGGLSIVISQSQTPACCVGDSLKERQRKHSQTTCSPRAEGLASLQAHLHTIPPFLSEPAEQMKQAAGRRGEVPRRREPVTATLLMKAMASEGNKERMNAAGANSQHARSKLCSRASAAPC